jgi:antitoxin component YwqK of YwqJK toxin-antitoxin module
MTKLHSISIFLIFISFQTIFSQTEINQIDKNGKRQGIWQGTYEESKRPKYKGTFVNGLETGTFEFYDDTKAGKVIATRVFNAKDHSAYTTFYDQKGNKVSEGNVVNKLFDGIWTYYHLESKTIMSTENYLKGKLEGLKKVYFKSGKIAEETYYTNNLKNGVYKNYAENGVILEETYYVNGIYHGEAIFRAIDGTITSKGKFVNGEKKGLWQFYKNGKLIAEINLSDPSNVNKVPTK